ncbi:T9SS type A sorting domain-containing protein [candidate division KSB1 bacterium]|nr:T9SS type A sorting domain-containing protein [candidate division KSB1 bacterium]
MYWNPPARQPLLLQRQPSNRDCYLYPNYPNPFNPKTTIRFDLDRAESVHLDIYNLRGERIKNVTSGVIKSGSHSVVWDGTNDLGFPVSSGVYLYRLTAGNRIELKKMVLVR